MSKKNELQKKPLAPLTTTLERLVAQNQDNFPFETRTAQRLQQNAIMTVAQNAKLMEVAIKNPGALAMQVYNFVALGLDMNMKEAYLVPFGNEIVPIIDYKGLVKLVNNFGKPEVSKIDFDLVRENDYINMENGKLTHTYKPFVDRGDIIGAYCSVLYENGETVYTLIDREEIAKVKASSKSSGNADSPWQKWEEAMISKTAIRKAMKTITLDFGKYDELHRTFERADDDVDFNNFNPNRENKDVVINQEDILDAETGEYEEVEIEL